MTKFKTFIKSHRIAFHLFLFVSNLFLSVYFLYSSKDVILSLSESDFVSIGFSAIFVWDSADFFMKLLDDLKENRKKDKKPHIISKPD